MPVLIENKWFINTNVIVYDDKLFISENVTDLR